MKVGFIGLGNMGRPMAENLIRAGHTLTVYNRSAAKAAGLDGATVAQSPSDAARDAEVVITMLADDHAVAEAIFGGDHEGAIGLLPKGSIHVSMSTISVDLSGRLATAHLKADQGYVAAPVFGRPPAAAQAALWVVAAGDARHVDRCRPLFDAIGRGLSVVSDNPAAANAVKVTGNFMIASVLETLGESFALVRKHEVAPAEFLAILNSVFRSPVYELYGALMAGERFEPAGFPVRLGLKDVRLALAAADSSGVPMPLASLLHDRFMAASGRGRAEQDWSSIAAVIAEDAGL